MTMTVKLRQLSVCFASYEFGKDSREFEEKICLTTKQQALHKDLWNGVQFFVNDIPSSDTLFKVSEEYICEVRVSIESLL